LDKADLAAEHDKLATHAPDRVTIIAAKINNRLEIRREPARQPHHFNIANCFAFKPTARMHPVQITINAILSRT
jgi:hypothetical protein